MDCQLLLAVMAMACIMGSHDMADLIDVPAFYKNRTKEKKMLLAMNI
jgi:hypothetical protein